MNRKKFGALIALLVLAMVVVACGGTAVPSAESSADPVASGGTDLTGEIALVVPESTSNDRAYWEELVTNFQAENPGITVNLTIVPWGDIATRVDTLIATNQPPDVLALNTWANYATDGLLHNIQEVVSPETFSDFDTNLLTAGKLDGVQYALPWVASTTSLAYNVDLLEEAGLPGPPTTWDELREYAATIQAETGKTGFGIRGAATATIEAMTMPLFNNGSDWIVDGEIKVNSPEAVEALTFLVDLTHEYKVTNPNPGTTDLEIYEAFARGEIGITLGGSFSAYLVDPVNPDLNYEIVPYPVSREGLEPVALVIQDSLMAFKTANDPRLAGRLLDFYLRSENFVKYQVAVGGLPATLSAQEVMGADPETRAYIETLHTGKFYPDTNPAWPAVDAAMRQQLPLVYEGRAPVQETLDQLQVIAERGP